MFRGWTSCNGAGYCSAELRSFYLIDTEQSTWMFPQELQIQLALNRIHHPFQLIPWTLSFMDHLHHGPSSLPAGNHEVTRCCKQSPCTPSAQHQLLKPGGLSPGGFTMPLPLHLLHHCPVLGPHHFLPGSHRGLLTHPPLQPSFFPRQPESPPPG